MMKYQRTLQKSKGGQELRMVKMKVISMTLSVSGRRKSVRGSMSVIRSRLYGKAQMLHGEIHSPWLLEVHG